MLHAGPGDGGVELVSVMSGGVAERDGSLLMAPAGFLRSVETAPRLLPALVLLLLVSLPLSAAGSADAWPFPAEMRSPLAFVHPFVNYALNPAWERDWERHLLQSNGVSMTVGSVSTQDLFTDLTVNVTEPLGSRSRFLYRMIWRQGLHLDVARQEHWLGLERGLSGPLAVQLQVHPTSDKSEFDLLAGLLLTDASRERYLRVGLRLDDFMFERKNKRGGTSREEAVGVQWELRHQVDRWEVFSSGSYGSGSRRAFPDSALSPDVAAAYRRSGASLVRLRRLLNGPDFLAIEASHYRFQAAEQRRDGVLGYEYGNEFVHLRGLGVLGIGESLSLRPEFHWLRQRTSATGRREFTHDREDVFPAVFLEYRTPGASTWELGYMAVHHAWEYAAGARTDDRSGSTDKIKAGWTYAFRPDARIQFSLSHELELDRFGGGNVQYQMQF